MEAKFIDTTTEERDGATWVTGRCPFCWEHFGVRAPAEGQNVTVHCPNDHALALDDWHSADAEKTEPALPRTVRRSRGAAV